MAVIEQISSQDIYGQDILYDIGAKGINISYNDNLNIIQKIDEVENSIDNKIGDKVDVNGGSLANTVAGSVTSQSNVSAIIATDRGSTIWGKINAIISAINNKVNSIDGSLANTVAGSITNQSNMTNVTATDKGSVIWGKINAIISKVSNLITQTNTLSTQLSNKIDKNGGDTSGTYVTNISSTSTVSTITTTNTLAQAWGKINALITDYLNKHKYATVYRNDSNMSAQGGAPHGIRYYNEQLQVYIPNSASSASTQDAGSWNTILKPLPKLVKWSDNATDNEIIAMLDAHYNNLLNIDCFWAAGDKRKINLSAMTSTGGYVNETHIAQTITFTILDFDHDTLITPINGHTKAAITVQQKDCLCYGDPQTVTGSSNRENGVMNTTNTNDGGWRDCGRRKWCNEIYYNAIPSTIKNKIKLVYKYSGDGSASSIRDQQILTTQDKIFLLSDGEATGNDPGIEGFLYLYMDVNFYPLKEGFIKLPKYTSDHDGHTWWTRTPTSTNQYRSIMSGGSRTSGNATATNYGLAPAFCL